MYVLEAIWHFIYMCFYYALVTLGWTLEMVLIFATFFLAALTLGKLW